MRGVEADAKPFRFAHVLDDCGNLLEAIAKAWALTSRRLERDLRFRLRQNAVNRVNRIDDSGEPRFLAGTEMRAWMEHEKRQLELIRPNEFFRERAQRIRVELRIRRSEIDQVTRMREGGVDLLPLRVI